MYTIMVNGRRYDVAHDKKLLPFLRDDLHLTAAKDGCGQANCGSCIVLVDGNKVKACLPKLSELSGKQILTAEGIPDAEKNVYQYCLAQAGAVSCSFCLPGLVLSAKSLLDHNLFPSREDVKQAMEGSTCAYIRSETMETAILMAASYFRESRDLPVAAANERMNRTAIYGEDVYLKGMLTAKVLYAPKGSLLTHIDISKALEHPDCVEILTKQDVPVNQIDGWIGKSSVMAGEGDSINDANEVIAIAATNHPDSLDEILSLIDVTYESIADSQAHISETSRSDCCTAIRKEEDEIYLYTTTESFPMARSICAQMLSIPSSQLHCHMVLTPDCRAFHLPNSSSKLTLQPYAALMAWYTELPVKVLSS